MIRVTIEATSPRRNRAAPRSISQRTTPSANMSARRSMLPLPELLGRHVADLPLEHAGFRVGEVQGGLGDPEVEELHLSLVGQEEVVGRDVAVDDVKRRGVVVGELVGVVQVFDACVAINAATLSSRGLPRVALFASTA